MRIEEDRIEILGNMYFCEDFDMKMLIANNRDYISISELETDIFVFPIEIVEETIIEKDVNIETGEEVEVERVIQKEKRGEKIYIFIDEKKRDNDLIYSQISEVNNDFDKRISEYLSKYPKREQDTFSEKKREAEKFLSGETSLYIEEKAKALGIPPEQFSQIIIAKNNEWTQMYVQLENEKDLKVAELMAKIQS